MQYFDIQTNTENLHISKLSLGSIYFGMTISDEDTARIIDCFLDAGGTYLDTARCYANWLPGGDGSSESAIGRYLKKSGKRNQIILGSKGGNTKKGENPYRANLTEEGLTKELNESLGFLGTDHLDIYWLHRDDPRLSVEEIVERVNGFIREGKVRSVGVSNWTEERLAAANKYAKKKGLQPFIMNQVQFSLAETTPELSGDTTIRCMNQAMREWYLDNDMPVAAFTSQGGGFYSKMLAGGADSLKPDVKNKFYHESNLKRLIKIQRIMAATGMSASQVVTGYLVNHPIQTTAILGSGSVAQLQDSLTGADVKLSREIIDFLEA